MFRKWVFLIGMVLFQPLYAEQLREESCDSNLINYTWEKKYGDVSRPDSSGRTLFKYATDKMLNYAQGDNKTCFDAYLLVVDGLLTTPTTDKSKSFNDRDYLIERLDREWQKNPHIVEKVTMNDPEINQLWGDYQTYQNQKDELAEEYEQLATSIVHEYCDGHYDQQAESGDYDGYMSQCQKEWQ